MNQTLDRVRLGMPNTDVQPLPPYLDPNFSQSLDRSRPHELVIKMHKDKPVDPIRQGSLTYRYTDTGELALVPNIWYNQTREMRVLHWEWEAKRIAASVLLARKRLAAVQACKESTFEGQKTQKVCNARRWHLQGQEDVATRVAAALKDVQSGTRHI